MATEDATAALVARLLAGSWRLVDRIEAEGGGFWIYGSDVDPRITLTKAMPLHSPRSARSYRFAPLDGRDFDGLQELAEAILEHERTSDV